MLSLTTLDKGRGEIGHSFVGGFSFCLDDRKKQVFSQFVSTGFVRGVDACPEFMKRTISERKEFASIRGLCFGCLQRGHLSKDCKKERSVPFATDNNPLHFMKTSEGARKTPVINKTQARYQRQTILQPASRTTKARLRLTQ